VPFSPGASWTRLELALGLIRLGHNVLIVEQVGEGWCYDKAGAKTSYHESWSRALFVQLMKQFNVIDQASQIYNHGQITTGVPLQSVLDFARDADILINNSGHITLDSIVRAVKRRVYVDLDPVYTQLWYAEYGKHRSLDDHDVFFTVGANIGTKNSPIPDCDKKWHYLARIVDLENWPYTYDADSRNFTTIANWAGYGELHYGGKTFKPKYSEFLRFAELASSIDQPLEVSLKNYNPDDPRIRILVENGWSVRKATEQIDTLENYRQYIAGSRAEIGIAQNAYVEGHSGWFSDRSAHYLACGKPVLAQATGFEEHLPTGTGLLAFKTLEEAQAGVGEINRSYKQHCEMARQIASDYFDYRKVLPEMLRISIS
jgi:hypothetical protein